MVGSKMERGSDFDSDLCLQTNLRRFDLTPRRKQANLISPVDVVQVGSYFVMQYYQLLQQRPEYVHKLYSDSSTMLRVHGHNREAYRHGGFDRESRFFAEKLMRGGAVAQSVSALLLLQQEEERHFMERNVNAALQKKLDELQRGLLQVTNEKVKALIELANLKEDYELLKE
ncbi:hypothetical protein Droror1_Dr00028331 [Drosera rotundifolia]